MKVGFFWFLPLGDGNWHLLARTLVLAEAEAYGDCLTHPGGHYDHWEELSARGTAWLQANGIPALVAHHQYEDFPRGRVVFDRARDRFTLYADRRLRVPPFPARVMAHFGLDPARTEMRGDPHYR